MQGSEGFTDISDDNLELDQWEDDEYADAVDIATPLPQSDVVPSNKKKGSSFVLLFLVFLLVAIIGIVYYYANTGSEIATPPIVNLENPLSSPFSETVNVNSATVDVSKNLTSNEVLSAHEKKSKKLNSGSRPVLTPLPDIAGLDNIQLAPLDADIVHTASISQEPTTVKQKETTETGPQEYNIASDEEKIISKTEESPETEPAQSSNEKTKTVIAHEIIGENVTKNKNADSAVSEAPKEDKVEKNETTNPKIALDSKKSSVQNDSVASRPEKIIWEIKGASPQRAVIYNKKSNETRTVEPGNNVKGLGRIKSIGKENGKWVVIGSSGRAEQ